MVAQDRHDLTDGAGLMFLQERQEPVVSSRAPLRGFGSQMGQLGIEIVVRVGARPFQHRDPLPARLDDEGVPTGEREQVAISAGPPLEARPANGVHPV